MYLNEKDAGVLSIVYFIVLFAMLLTVIMQAQRIHAIKAEKELKIVELEQIKETLAHPKITKDPEFKIVYRDRQIHMSAMEKEALAQEYEMKLADLQALMDAICDKSERSLEITKTGKQTSEPVYPPTAAKQKRMAITAEVFNHDMATLGVVYELIPKWGLSLGIAASNYGKIGGACVIKF